MKNHFLFVFGIASLHAAFIGGGVEDGVLLSGRDLPRCQAQVNAAHISNTAQQRQLVSDGRVAFQGQRRMISPARNEMVRTGKCPNGTVHTSLGRP